LKASAIASISSAVFPNNFTNLPKVTPPFLGQLESGKKYCLVLDLDETLIHNVEVSRPFLIVTVFFSLFLNLSLFQVLYNKYNKKDNNNTTENNNPNF
jgi:hypothetical protein